MGDKFESSLVNLFYGIFSIILCIPCGYYGGSWSLENLTYVIADSVRDLPFIIYIIVFVHAFIPTIIITFLPLLIYNFTVRDLTQKKNRSDLYSDHASTERNVEKDNRTTRQKLSFVAQRNEFDRRQRENKSDKTQVKKISAQTKPHKIVKTVNFIPEQKSLPECKFELRRLKKELGSVVNQIDPSGRNTDGYEELLGKKGDLAQKIAEIESVITKKIKNNSWN